MRLVEMGDASSRCILPVSCVHRLAVFLKRCTAAVLPALTACRYSKEPEAQLNPKKKQFEKIAPDLRVDASE